MPGTWVGGSLGGFDMGPQGSNLVWPVHMIHVYHDSWNDWGRFLVFGEGRDIPFDTPEVYLWKPPAIGQSGNGDWLLIPNTRTNLFCCGHTHLADGRILCAGGQFLYNQSGQPATNHLDIFKPTAAGGVWNPDGNPPDMQDGRWYATCTRTPDDRILITSGELNYVNRTINALMELYTPAAAGPGTLAAFPRTAQELDVPSYPNIFVLDETIGTNGYRIAYAGGNQQAQRIEGGPGAPSTWGDWERTLTGLFNNAHAEREHNTSAILIDPMASTLRCMIAKFGGVIGADDERATRAFSLLFRNQSFSYAWQRALGQNKARQNANAVITPDACMALIGGNDRTVNDEPYPTGAVLTAEFINPRSWPTNNQLWPETAGNMAGGPIGRSYHSSASLMSDSRIIVAGGHPNIRTGQFLEPPYFAATRRPHISAAPSSIQCGATGLTCDFEYIGGGDALQPRVVLVSLAAVTHGFDQNQRFIELEVTAFDGGGDPMRVTFNAPANVRIAPPGYYMLFLVRPESGDGYRGVPCRNAKYVKVVAP